MKKILSIVFLFGLMLMPNLLFADTVDESNPVSSETKYYKTVTYYDNSPYLISTLDGYESITTEVSEEEYNLAIPDENTRGDAAVETTYKRLESTIYKNGNYYRYKATLNWKLMPSKRSYDIIAIGFYSSVKVHSNLVLFSQYYCKTSGSCYTSSTNTPQVFTNGAGTSFALPSGDLTTLRQTFYFDVEKTGSGTLVSQIAAGDYAHATSSISLTNSKKYSVGAGGIQHNGNSSYYDAIGAATATWSGSW